MFNRDRWKEILEVLTSNWFRTVLTAFGVFWGILILIILTCLQGRGSRMESKRILVTSLRILCSCGRGVPPKRIWASQLARNFRFKIEDVETLKEKFPQLRYISPRNQLGGFGGNNNVVRGIKTGAYNVYGDYPEIIKQEPMAITPAGF